MVVFPVLAANSVTIRDTSGGAQKDRVIILPRFFAESELSAYARPVINGTPAAQWQCDRRSQWDDGSLQWALVSFKASLPGGGSITVTFEDSPSSCSLGEQAACDAAGLDQPAMLGFSGGTWGGRIEATQNATIRSADVRAMIGGGNFTYLLKGPVVTQVLVEDVTPARAYDFGWSCKTNCSGDYSSATWEDDLTHRSLHPRFLVTFPDGSPGVRVQPMIENVWTTALQDQRYSLVVKDKANNVVANVGPFTQWARTRRSKGLAFWSGPAPGTIRIDHNLGYLVESRIIPNYDTSIKLQSSAIAKEKSEFNKDFCNWGQMCGYDYNRTPDDRKRFGSMEEAGFFERWNAQYLYTFNDDLKKVALTNCEVSESIPIHYRESSQWRYFVDENENGSADDDGVDAFGRVVSVDARREFTTLPAWIFTEGADKLKPLKPLSDAHNWGPDSAHQPSFCVVSYLTTGDHYMLEEIQQWAARNIAQGNFGDCNFCRHHDWGYLTDSAHQVRGQGWAARTIGYAGLLSTGYERTYFRQKLKYHAAVMEGFFDITDGLFHNHARHGAKWTWGRKVVDFGKSNPLNLPVPPHKNSVKGGVDKTKACDSQSQFMQHYKITAEGWLRDVGYFWFDKIVEAQSRLLIEQTLNTAGSSVYLGTAYHLPITKNDGSCKGPKDYFTTVASMYDALSAKTKGELEPNFRKKGSYLSPESGFDHSAKAAAAAIAPYSYNGRNGADVWKWYSANVGNQKAYATNPKWAFVPRPNPTLSTPRISSVTLFDGAVGSDYIQVLEASGGKLPYTWSAVGGLCAGLEMQPSGVISGVPSVEQTCRFDIKVTDSANNSDTRSVSISIALKRLPSRRGARTAGADSGRQLRSRPE